MKGLLLKDFYVAVKHCRMHLVMMLAFLVLSAMDGVNMLLFMTFPCVLAGMLPVTLLAYDERSHWCEYCGTMPCTKREVVSVKFIVVLTVQGVLLLFSLLVQGVRMAVASTVDGALLMMYASFLCVMGSVSAVMLPLSFKYGVEKGRIAYYLVVVGLSGGSALLSSATEAANLMPGTGLCLTLMAVAAAFYALCYWLSVRFYEKREG